MKVKLITILALVCTTTVALADSVTDFLAVRKANKLTTISGVQALDSLIGTKVLEVRAHLKGVVKVGQDASLLLENPDQSSLTIRTANLPDWLDGTDLDIRLIVKASRASEVSPLETTMLAVTTESLIKKFDPMAVTAKPKATVKSTTPAADPRNPLRGPIGRGSKPSPSRGGSSSRSAVSVAEAIPIYAGFIKKRNKRLTDQECWDIASLVIEFSSQNKVDPRLIMAMAIQESNFNPNATSRAGAQGLLQLMPGTAAGLGVRNSYDITQNLFGAVKLISNHLVNYTKKTGDPGRALELALAAYNAGAGAVKRHGGIPPYRETQNYVRRIIAIYSELAS
jgi:Transglycosylase SLT domain